MDKIQRNITYSIHKNQITSIDNIVQMQALNNNPTKSQLLQYQNHQTNKNNYDIPLQSNDKNYQTKKRHNHINRQRQSQNQCQHQYQRQQYSHLHMKSMLEKNDKNHHHNHCNNEGSIAFGFSHINDLQLFSQQYQKENCSLSLINLPKQMKDSPYNHANKKVQNRPILKLLFESDVDVEADVDVQIVESRYEQSIKSAKNVKQTQKQHKIKAQNHKIHKKQEQSQQQHYEEQEQSMHFYNESTYRQSQATKTTNPIMITEVQHSYNSSTNVKIKTQNSNNQLQGYIRSPINIATFKPKELKHQLREVNKQILQSKLKSLQQQSIKDRQNQKKQKTSFSESQRLKFIQNNTHNHSHSRNHSHNKMSSTQKNDSNVLNVNRQSIKKIIHKHITEQKQKSKNVNQFNYLYEESRPKTKYEAILDNYFKQNKEKQIKEMLMFNGPAINIKRPERSERAASMSMPSKQANSNQHNKYGRLIQSKLLTSSKTQTKNSQINRKKRSQSCSSIRKNQVTYYKNKNAVLKQQIQKNRIPTFYQQKLKKTYSCDKIKLKTQPIHDADYLNYHGNQNGNSNSDRWMSLNFNERQQKVIQNRRQKQEVGKKENTLKQTKNCTFKPKLTQFKGITSSRDCSTTYAKMYLQKIKKRGH